MSAIGDYVHLHAKNYNLYGINRNKPGEMYNFIQQKENINSRLKTSGITNKKGLENALNSILSTDDNSQDNTAAIRQEVENILSERFGETLGKIDWETGNISARIKNAKGNIAKTFQASANQQSIELKSILSRIRAIEDARNNIKNKEEQQALTEKINNIYINLNEIITGFKKGRISELKNSGLNQLTRNNRIDLNNPGTQNLITTINSLLKEYAATPAINLQKGDLFEYLIALAPAVASKKAGQELDKYFKQLETQVSGGDRSRIIIDFNKNSFTDDIDLGDLDFKGYVTSESTKTIYSYGTSQEKIDVNLEWEGKKLGISAKNVNLKSQSGVHILSGSSMLYLLQDESSDFVNHYFNIVATHEDNVRVNADISAAHDAMKYTLLFKALSGETFGRQGATLFIVNDNTVKGGGVKIYDIADLVKKASSNLNLYSNITSNKIPLDSLKILNEKKSNYSERITSFIAEVHKQKISAILTPALLN